MGSPSCPWENYLLNDFMFCHKVIDSLDSPSYRNNNNNNNSNNNNNDENDNDNNNASYVYLDLSEMFAQTDYVSLR